MTPLFSFAQRHTALTEYYDHGAFFFVLSEDGSEKTISLYETERPSRPTPLPYLGYTKEEILAGGRDLLGERLMQNGDPKYTEVKSALPPLETETYTLLGGVTSVAGLTVDADGIVYNQSSGRSRATIPIFTPTSYDPELGAIKPYQTLVGKEYPLLLSVHTNGERTLEFLYFVEPTEPDRDPICWIRIKRYQNASPETVNWEYRVAAIAREADEHELFATPPSESLFWDALCDTLAFWVEFSKAGAAYTLPDEELARVAHGSPLFAALTFTAEHAHYGHRFYGKELHDHFPPNYIFAIEALICMGKHARAREVFTHLLKYVLRRDGQINYRQGTGLQFGASAAEYGMLLHLANRYRHALGIDELGPTERKKLIGMGEILLEHWEKCPDLGGLRLIRMCAEADTNERVHVYLNNNLWAVRGLWALADLLGKEGEHYRNDANALRDSVNTALEKYAARDTRFGTLPPFRLGYTATPLTLSSCEDTFYPTDTDTRDGYFHAAWKRDDRTDGEDLIENTYANYRYYPEMLSAMLLPDEYTRSFVKMREAIGGELLGMTRFLSHVDNWPVLNYARFLIETGRIEKYLLLLFSHAAHHGIPDLMTYFEQVSIDGKVNANDCIPSLLTVPTMLAWAFAYETVDQTSLRLLAALPKEWFWHPFRAERIGFSNGLLTFVSDGKTLTVQFDRAPGIPVELILRAKESIRSEDIQIGADHVTDIRKNVILLDPSVKEISIALTQ